MKYRNAGKSPNERDRLRQFKELDDAFARALQELDDPNAELDIPTGPPVRSLAALEEEDGLKARDEAFSQRLRALMAEYAISDAELAELAQTLIDYGLWEAPQR